MNCDLWLNMISSLLLIRIIKDANKHYTKQIKTTDSNTLLVLHAK